MLKRAARSATCYGVLALQLAMVYRRESVTPVTLVCVQQGPAPEGANDDDLLHPGHKHCHADAAPTRHL